MQGIRLRAEGLGFGAYLEFRFRVELGFWFGAQALTFTDLSFNS